MSYSFISYFRNKIDNFSIYNPLSLFSGEWRRSRKAILLDSANHKLNLHKLLKNHYTIVSLFSGKWCPVCRLELKAYDELLSKYEKSDLQMIAIYTDFPDEVMDEVKFSSGHVQVLKDRKHVFLQQVLSENGFIQLNSSHREQLSTFLKESEENDSNHAIYIIDNNSVIQKAWFDIDSISKMEPRIVLKELLEIKNRSLKH